MPLLEETLATIENSHLIIWESTQARGVKG
jgi:hypothetical protein